MSQNTREFAPNSALQAMLDSRQPANPVAEELAALRREIQQLRAALAPSQSIIITGPVVERIYQALKDQP